LFIRNFLVYTVLCDAAGGCWKLPQVQKLCDDDQECLTGSHGPGSAGRAWGWEDWPSQWMIQANTPLFNTLPPENFVVMGWQWTTGTMRNGDEVQCQKWRRCTSQEMYWLLTSQTQYEEVPHNTLNTKHSRKCRPEPGTEVIRPARQVSFWML
jgi:hypothetical protein